MYNVYVMRKGKGGGGKEKEKNERKKEADLCFVKPESIQKYVQQECINQAIIKYYHSSSFSRIILWRNDHVEIISAAH